MKSILLVLVLALTGFIIRAQGNQIYSTKAGAIKGYDPVAYFIQGEALEGVKDISVNWNKATWYFTSQANKEAFLADPEKYAPQFGGYCAYAAAKGYTYRTDPKAWKIVDGRLYLNFDKKIQETWEEKQSEYILLGHQNWPGILKKE